MEEKKNVVGGAKLLLGSPTTLKKESTTGIIDKALGRVCPENTSFFTSSPKSHSSQIAAPRRLPYLPGLEAATPVKCYAEHAVFSYSGIALMVSGYGISQMDSIHWRGVQNRPGNDVERTSGPTVAPQLNDGKA